MSTKIFITCPETDYAVWTGFRAPPGTGLTGLKQVTLRKCRACGKAHTWDASAAYWYEATEPVSSWAKIRNFWRRSGRSHA